MTQLQNLLETNNPNTGFNSNNVNPNSGFDGSDISSMLTSILNEASLADLEALNKATGIKSETALSPVRSDLSFESTGRGTLPQPTVSSGFTERSASKSTIEPARRWSETSESKHFSQPPQSRGQFVEHIGNGQLPELKGIGKFTDSSGNRQYPGPTGSVQAKDVHINQQPRRQGRSQCAVNLSAMLLCDNQYICGIREDMQIHEARWLVRSMLHIPLLITLFFYC